MESVSVKQTAKSSERPANERRCADLTPLDNISHSHQSLCVHMNHALILTQVEYKRRSETGGNKPLLCAKDLILKQNYTVKVTYTWNQTWT